MARNNIQPGQTLTFTAPYAVASGAGFQVGKVFAVALHDAPQGSPVEGRVVDVWDLAKATGQAWTAFVTDLYWDNTAKVITSTVGTNLKVGVPTQNQASGDTIGRVRLNGTF